MLKPRNLHLSEPTGLKLCTIMHQHQLNCANCYMFGISTSKLFNRVEKL